MQGNFFFLGPVFSDCNWHLAFSALASQPAQLSSKFGALDLVLSSFVTMLVFHLTQMLKSLAGLRLQLPTRTL